jgi:hypothetical protein
MNKPPQITINGEKLTSNQALTWQYAIDRYDVFLAKKGLGEDELAIKITDNYRKNIAYFKHLINQ